MSLRSEHNKRERVPDGSGSGRDKRHRHNDYTPNDPGADRRSRGAGGAHDGGGGAKYDAVHRHEHRGGYNQEVKQDPYYDRGQDARSSRQMSRHDARCVPVPLPWGVAACGADAPPPPAAYIRTTDNHGRSPPPPLDVFPPSPLDVFPPLPPPRP